LKIDGTPASADLINRDLDSWKQMLAHFQMPSIANAVVGVSELGCEAGRSSSANPNTYLGQHRKRLVRCKNGLLEHTVVSSGAMCNKTL
jgi:hypothetical protein